MVLTDPSLAQVRPGPAVHHLRLPDQVSLWVWASTCTQPRCTCREVLVAVSSTSEQAAADLGAQAGAARDRVPDFPRVIPAGAPVAWLDLDSGMLHALSDAHPCSHPDLAVLAMHVDGAWLDELGREWFRRKRKPVPEGERRPQILDATWKRGDLLAWDDVFEDVRNDAYIVDGASYIASDFHCPDPACTCGEMVIEFSDSEHRHSLALKVDAEGRATPRWSGAARLDASRAALLDRLWSAYMHRHPHYRERLATRAAALRAIWPELQPVGKPVIAAPKPGRNDACPCGSGKKFKKCCWLQPSGARPGQT